MEQSLPEYPLNRTGDYRIVHIEDCVNGVITEHILMLTPAEDKGRSDQWSVWLNAEYEGIMGWWKAITLQAKLFLRVRAI